MAKHPVLQRARCTVELIINKNRQCYTYVLLSGGYVVKKPGEFMLAVAVKTSWLNGQMDNR